ncbi:MAG TPA: hypothetical protein DET40_07645 [Lentisphaeria bacterium]|nr:MAG: hypothetical protein A2X45_06650 [Lentisphaerae bacterium GWF2_50_93]HCE43406.1 hypothetical protein [Lentisphaeria bacterium]
MAISAEKINEALKLLEDAAKENREQVLSATSGKFENLKCAMLDEKGLKERLALAAQKAADMAASIKEAAADKTREIAGAIDQNVRKNPWPYVAGVAVGALMLGFILGRKTAK